MGWSNDPVIVYGVCIGNPGDCKETRELEYKGDALRGDIARHGQDEYADTWLVGARCQSIDAYENKKNADFSEFHKMLKDIGVEDEPYWEIVACAG